MTETTTAGTAFIDRCHYSETGWATWKRNEHNQTYCTCQEAAKPEGESDDDES